MFDFEKAIKEAKEATSSPLMGAVVLGSSGAGKSTLMGTAGVKTLYLYTTGEDHGVKSAGAIKGADLVPVCVDFADGKKLDADQTYQRILDVLKEHDALKKLGVKCVAVDGASEIEATIRETSAWKKLCSTAQGKHNTFAEGGATITLFRPIINALKEVQRKVGAHFIVTCLLDVKDLGVNGEILEASPRLQGYSVAESLVQQFGDVLVVGRMEREGQVKHKLQFMSEITKTSKDEKGSLKRAMNFSPRIAGLQNPPALLDADLKEIIRLKGQK